MARPDSVMIIGCGDPGVVADALDAVHDVGGVLGHGVVDRADAQADWLPS